MNIESLSKIADNAKETKKPIKVQDGFEDLNDKESSTEAIANWAEKYLKPLVEKALEDEGDKAEVEVKVDGDKIEITSEVADSVLKRAIRKVKTSDSRLRRILQSRLKVKDSQLVSEDQLKSLRDLMLEYGVRTKVSLSDGDILIESEDGEFKEGESEIVDSVLKSWQKLNNFNVEFVKDDDEDEVIEDPEESSKEAAEEGGQGGPENREEEDEAWNEHEEGESLDPADKMKDWADEVILPVLEKHLDEIGVHASYAIDADENGVTVDLAAESRNDDKGLEEGEDGILDSIVDSVRAAGKGCYRTRVRFKLSDSTLSRRVILG